MTPTVTLHRTCKTLSLYAFIECYCNNDLSFLIISGEPTADELQAAWNEILFEYSGLIKNEQSEYIFQLAKRIGMLQHHIFYIENATSLLRYRYDVEIADEVRAMGYKLSSEDVGSEEYNSQINMIISRCKTRVYELGELTDEYNRLDKTVSGKKQTEEEFSMTVASLSKYQGYNINKRETTVLEFTAIFNLFLKEIAHQKKEAGHGS